MLFFCRLLSEQGDDTVALDLRLQVSSPVRHKKLPAECEFSRQKNNMTRKPIAYISLSGPYTIRSDGSSISASHRQE
jgi:hypothetical protein